VQTVDHAERRFSPASGALGLRRRHAPTGARHLELPDFVESGHLGETSQKATHRQCPVALRLKLAVSDGHAVRDEKSRGRAPRDRISAELKMAAR
jgi:hypothetical protein